ncbi:SGNH/GDSL hydrolase family protein [Herbiconiux sp. SYSU D00978]|uniref:SGNH/GDSL hydrolase family protein n=1 Tax=Herbiconiux sp. SYSU D00978 TaxID=2812562 RepID=UPI001A971DA6|nr:SGNH/GDSL hydrolase family protein [Herbiconiux sp. SYSU D00978]
MPLVAALLIAGCSTEMPMAASVTAQPVSSPAPVARTVPERSLSVAFVGDSITEGFGFIDYDRIWPARVCAQYGWEFQQFSSGGTGYVAVGETDIFASRIPAIVAARPDVVVLAGGTNDVWYSQSRLQAAAAGMIATLRSELPETQIILLSGFLQPKYVHGNRPDGRELADVMQEQTDMLHALAVQHELHFIDTRPLFQVPEVGRYVLNDGIHPNNTGHARIAEQLGPLIAEAIAEEH